MIRAEDKIASRAELARKLAALQASGERIVFANGCFDLLHVGHLRFLAVARSLGSRLVAAVNSDRSAAELKGPGRPVLPAAQRMRVLAALECVDFVVEFDEATPEDLLRELLPDVLAKGGDYAGKEILGREIVEARGGRAVALPYLEGYSTSALLEKMRASRAP